jgi:hypothetical protein
VRRLSLGPYPILSSISPRLTVTVLGRELMAAPWWVWGAFALASLALLALLALLRMKGRNIGA